MSAHILGEWINQFKEFYGQEDDGAFIKLFEEENIDIKTILEECVRTAMIAAKRPNFESFSHFAEYYYLFVAAVKRYAEVTGYVEILKPLAEIEWYYNNFARTSHFNFQRQDLLKIRMRYCLKTGTAFKPLANELYKDLHVNDSWKLLESYYQSMWDASAAAVFHKLLKKYPDLKAVKYYCDGEDGNFVRIVEQNWVDEIQRCVSVKDTMSTQKLCSSFIYQLAQVNGLVQEPEPSERNLRHILGLVYELTSTRYGGTVLLPINQALDPTLASSPGECAGYDRLFLIQIMYYNKIFMHPLTTETIFKPVSVNYRYKNPLDRDRLNHTVPLTTTIIKLQREQYCKYFDHKGRFYHYEKLTADKVTLTNNVTFAEAIVEKLRVPGDIGLSIGLQTEKAAHAFSVAKKEGTVIDEKTGEKKKIDRIYFCDANSAVYYFDKLEKLSEWLLFYTYEMDYDLDFQTFVIRKICPDPHISFRNFHLFQVIEKNTSESIVDRYVTPLIRYKFVNWIKRGLNEERKNKVWFDTQKKAFPSLAAGFEESFQMSLSILLRYTLGKSKSTLQRKAFYERIIAEREEERMIEESRRKYLEMKRSKELSLLTTSNAGSLKTTFC